MKSRRFTDFVIRFAKDLFLKAKGNKNANTFVKNSKEKNACRGARALNLLLSNLTREPLRHVAPRTSWKKKAFLDKSTGFSPKIQVKFVY